MRVDTVDKLKKALPGLQLEVQLIPLHSIGLYLIYINSDLTVTHPADSKSRSLQRFLYVCLPVLLNWYFILYIDANI